MDDNPGPFLRLHLVDGDTIDLDTGRLDPAIELDAVAEAIKNDALVRGNHVGGSPCAVPTASILWAEAIG